MTRRCLLHLGMDKTGSTSIQRVFRDYADSSTEWLRAKGHTHTQLVCLPFRTPVPQPLYSARTEDGQAQERAAARAALDAALGGTDRSVILSSEFLSDFPTPGNCAALAEALRAHVDALAAIVYLRDPGTYVKSVVQQVLKLSMPRADLGTYVPRYRFRLERWEHVLGRAAMTYRPFARDALRDRDLIADFAHHAGLDPAHVPARRRRQANVSLSAGGTAALLLYRQRFPSTPRNPRLRQARGRMIQTLKSFGAGSFEFAAETLTPALRDRADDIRWAEERLGHPLTPSPDAPDYRFSGLDDMARFGRELWPELRAWALETLPDLETAAGDPAALLDEIVMYFAQGPAKA